MSSKVSKRLNRRAAELPKIPTKHRQRLSVAEVKARGVNFDSDGEPITDHDKRLFSGLVDASVNHHSRIKHAYAQGGWDAVEAYCDHVNMVHDQLQEEQRKAEQAKVNSGKAVLEEQADFA